MDPSRKWPVMLAFVLVVAVGVAAVVRDWQWALIAAGAMVVVLALAVGTDLSKWAMSAGKDGLSMSAERAAREEVQKAAGELATGTAVEGRVTESVGGPGLTEADFDKQRRDQIVRLMTTAAQWGWLQGKTGLFQTAPHPVVIWDGDRPQILYGVAVGDIEGGPPH